MSSQSRCGAQRKIRVWNTGGGVRLGVLFCVAGFLVGSLEVAPVAGVVAAPVVTAVSLTVAGEPPGTGYSTSASLPAAVPLVPPNDFSSTVPTVADTLPLAASPVSTALPKGYDPATSTEVVSARSAFKQTFRNSDGTESSRFTTDAVNYQVPTGEWLPVDNRLTVDKTGVVHNAANSWSVNFGSLSQGVSIDTGKNVVGWRAQSFSDASPVIEPDGKSVRYVNAWPGVDLVYRVRGSAVEEFIELKDPSASTAFLFDVKGVALTGDQKSGWRAGGVMAGSGIAVPPPFSVDASSASVNDKVLVSVSSPVASGAEPVAMTANRAADVNQVMSVAVDPGWLQTLPADRFPVTIDPSWEYFPPGCCALDPVQSYTPGGLSWPGLLLAGDTVQWRTIMAFDITSIFGATVSQAHLAFDANPVGTGIRNLYGYVATSWLWQNPVGSPVIFDSIDADSTVPQDMHQSDNLTAQYNTWAQSNSFGALLIMGDEVAGGIVGGLPSLFLTYNFPPAVPTLSTPPDGQSQHAVTVAFSAIAPVPADPNGDPVTYQIFYCTDQACQPNSRINVPTTVTSQSITSTFAFPISPVINQYFWGVTASDGLSTTTTALRSIWIVNYPPVVVQTAPPINALYDLLPTLQATISDPDGGPLPAPPENVNYRFVVTPQGGSGVLAASPWQALIGGATDVPKPVSWQLPAALVSSRGYEWRVEVKDADGALVGQTTKRPLSAQGRLGVDSVSPIQSAGPVSVNLATGNLFAAVGAGRSMSTVGGASSVGLAYNSKDQSTLGLNATYYVDANADFIPQTSEIKMSRVDPLASFDWGSGSPGEAVPVPSFNVQWTGFLRVPVSGALSFGGGHKGVLKVKAAPIGQPLVTLYDSSTGLPIGDPGVFAGSTPTPVMTAGQLLQIEVNYRKPTAGVANTELRVQIAGAEYQVVQSWFTTSVPTLPTGWTLSGDTGLGASWTAAKVLEDGVLLTAVDGSQAMFTKTTAAGVTSWKTPAELDDVVVVNADSTVMVHGADGVETSFTKDGVINDVTTAADDLKKAGARAVYDTGGVTGATLRLVRLEDRLNPTRAIVLSYKPVGSAAGNCPLGVAPFDALPPEGMLCKVDYPDGSSTRLYYQGQSLLARISDPGDETPNAAPEGRQITDLRWTAGQLTSVLTPFNNDVINNQAALPVARQIPVADLETDIAWSAAKPSMVTQPRPNPAPAVRPQVTFGWLSSSQTTVTVAGIAGVSRTVTFDAAGRTTNDADAVGRSTSTTWATAADVVLKSSSGGRTSSTVYDKWWHPVDSYGPAQSSCFVGTAPPVGTEYQSYPPNGSCTGVNSVPRSHTDYDHNLSGLQGAYWPNSSFNGSPTSHSMAIGGGAINYDYPATAPPGIVTTDNWAARYTGDIYLPVAGAWIFRLSVAPADTVRLVLDDVPTATLTGSGSQWISTDISRTYPVGETYPLAIKVRLDQAAGVGASGVKLQWQGPGVPTFVDVPASATKPGFWYPTRSTVSDAGTGVAASMVSETRFDEGIDPVYGVATSSTIDPTGLALKTVTGFEAPGPTSLLRRTRRTLPAFAVAPSTANSSTYNYWGDSETAANPCVVGSPLVLQSGLQKQAISATPATGTAITTETVYDILGRPVASRYLPDTAWTCTTYDARGRVIQVKYPPDATYPSGRTVTTTYRANSTGAPTGDIYVTTVADNSVTGSTNGSTITAVIDALGQKVSYTDVWNNTTTSAYDQAGRLTTTTAPNGTYGYSYDTVGRLTSETRGGVQMIVPTYTSDNAALDPGVMSQIDYPSGVGNGGNGTRGVITRDSLGRTSSIAWTNIATGTVITSDAVTRSLTGKVLTDTTDGAGTPAWTYTYDSVGRLTNAIGSSHNYVYGYAATGGCGANTAAGQNSNRTSLADNATLIANYCYDNTDRLTSTTQTGYATAISYDSHGNTTQIAGQALTYDYANRHIGTYVPNATSPTSSVVYQRDATDRIVSRIATGSASTTRFGFCGSGDSPCVSMNASNTIIEQDVGLPGGVSVTVRPSGVPPPTTLSTKTFDSTTNGFANWYGSTVTTTTAQKRTGTASLQVTATAAAWGVLDGTSPTQAVTAGTNYTFLIWAKASTVGAPIIPLISWRNSAGGSLDDAYVYPAVTDTTTAWTQVQVSAIAPVGATSVKFGITINTSAVGQVHYFDDYTLTTSPMTVTTVVSKGFETTTDNMTVTSAATATATTAQAHTGTRSLAIVPTASWSVTDASPGTTINAASIYQVTGWEKLSTGSAGLQVGVLWQNSAGTLLRQDNIVNAINASTAWTAFATHEMTPPAGAVTAKIQLYGGTIAGATWYTDDIVLSTVAPAATTVAVWSYPNIHGDIQAVANDTGIKQGATFNYDPYGNALTGIVDNQDGAFDNGWLGQHQRSLEHQTGLAPLIEMGARGYNPTLGRFLETDPVEGGNANDYTYPTDSINLTDIDGRCAKVRPQPTGNMEKCIQAVRDYESRVATKEHRQLQYLNNDLDLPMRGKAKSGTRVGHQRAIDKMDVSINEAKARILRYCDGGSGWWHRVPAPDQRTVAIVAAGTGLAILGGIKDFIFGWGA